MGIAGALPVVVAAQLRRFQEGTVRPRSVVMLCLLGDPEMTILQIMHQLDWEFPGGTAMAPLHVAG